MLENIIQNNGGLLSHKKVKRNIAPKIDSFNIDDIYQGKIIITYQPGEQCQADTTQSYTSELKIICDINSTNSPVPTIVNNKQPCFFQFELRTIEACRICNIDDVYAIYVIKSSRENAKAMLEKWVITSKILQIVISRIQVHHFLY